MGMLDARGALVIMDRAIMASRAIDDAFALVSTDGVPGVPVLHENRRIGTTDGSGHFIVPDLQAFQRNQLGIDTLALPADARIDVDRMVAVPRNGAGVLARFPVSLYRGASVILVDEQGKPLPVGTRVTLQDGGASALVGYDGVVFFDTLAQRNRLVAEFGEKTCIVDLSFDARAAMTTLGPFVCTLREKTR